MFSYAVSSSSVLGSWNTIPNDFLTVFFFFEGSFPLTVIFPFVAVSSVVSIFIVVVFPAPFGPRNANIFPFSTENDMLSTALKPSYFFVSSFTFIISFMLLLCFVVRLIIYLFF